MKYIRIKVRNPLYIPKDMDEPIPLEYMPLIEHKIIPLIPSAIKHNKDIIKHIYMKHSDIQLINNFLIKEGYKTTGDPVYFVKKNTAIDVFSDGLVQIWRIKQNEKIGEFKARFYQSFVNQYNELKEEKYGLK